MRCCSSLFLLIALTFAACTQPVAPSGTTGNTGAAETTTSPQTTANGTKTCPDHFYYYEQQKVTIRIRPQLLLVGFQAEMSTEAKTTLLKRYAEFENLSPAQTADSGPFHIVKLKASTTCRQALDLINNLQAQPEVVFANPVFHSPARLGSEYLWLGLTSEILVTVRSEANTAAIKELVAQTNTRLIDTIGETTLLIQATKDSRGNALEMANFFHEQPDVINSEPNFYLASREGDVSSPANR
ncbi:MAG TPA: hypothetical protein VK927_07070 [Adhaeribacter sp.]|nr:hypothetical protein [Adhaeribacter sp.]